MRRRFSAPFRGELFNAFNHGEPGIENTTLTSGINAEYGGALGGVIAAVTKSGGNLFSGEGHYYYIGNGMSAGPIQRIQLSPVDNQTVFHLQDDIMRRVVEALALPLGGGTDSPTLQAPRNARAYALYLQANELARTYDQMTQARELYERCLELDPGFAPAWAQLGRCHRVIGKYIDFSAAERTGRAEEALRRALELDPRLSLAHKFYAQLESDMGQPRAALVRLLGAAARHGNDPELFAGLVHACRYCGLFEQSIAAHEEAKRLDPNVATSLDQTLLMAGDIERLLAAPGPRSAGGGDQVIRVIALGLEGRRDEARQRLIGLLDGVREAEQIGVQRLPAERFQRSPRRLRQQRRLGLEARAIDVVTEQRMPNMGEMHPDLMGPAGLQSAGQEARDRLAVRAGVGFQPLPMGDGLASALAHRLLVARLGVAIDRRVDRAFRAVRRAPDESEVAAPHLAGLAVVGELRR